MSTSLAPTIDARAVSLPARRPLGPGEAPPHTDAMKVLGWSLDTRYPESACSRCDRWDSARRTTETSFRPPGAQGRDSCSGCYASFLSQFSDEDEPGAAAGDPEAVHAAWQAALEQLRAHREELRNRERMAREWNLLKAEVKEYEAAGRGTAARAAAEARVPTKLRIFGTEEQAKFRTRGIKLEMQLSRARKSCLAAGFDPSAVSASGGLFVLPGGGGQHA